MTSLKRHTGSTDELISGVTPSATSTSQGAVYDLEEAPNVFTSSFTASANLIHRVDSTTGQIVATLPAAPTNKTRVVIKLVIQGGTNAVTINCAGSDVFNKTGGGTSLTLSLLNQGVLLQYKASGGIWTVVADDLSLSQLDKRYGKNTLVLDAMEYGVVFDGTSDIRAGMEAVVTAAAALVSATQPVVIQLPAGTGALTSIRSGAKPTNPSTGTAYSTLIGIPLPVNLAGQLIIKGRGKGASVVKLSDNARNLFYIDQTADYQYFRNVRFEDFTVDNNNTNGFCHILIGNEPSSQTQQRHLNYDNVEVRRVDILNVPTDFTRTTCGKSGIRLNGAHVNALEATGTSTTNVTVEDVRVYGGDNGVQVCSNGVTGNGGTNHYYDNIVVRRCRHEIATAPTQTNSQTSFYICGSGYGDYCLIEDCYSKNIADDGIEIGAMQRPMIRNFKCVNPYLMAILFRNTHALADSDAQRAVMEDVEVINTAELGAIASARGAPVAWTVDTGGGNFGSFLLDNFSLDSNGFSYSVRTNGDLGFVIANAARRVEMRNCKIRIRNFSHDTASAIDYSYLFTNMSLSNRNTFICRDLDVLIDTFTGSTGSGNMFMRGIVYGGSACRNFVDGVELNVINFVNTAGAGGSFRAASFGRTGSVFFGKLRRLSAFLTGSGGVSTIGVSIEETAGVNSATIEDCDFRAFGSGGVLRATPSGTTSVAIAERGNIYATIPTPATVTATGSPFAYRNTSGLRQLVTITGGTVTKLEIGTTAASYTDTLLTAGTFVIDHAQYLRATYSSAPTITTFPLA